MEALRNVSGLRPADDFSQSGFSLVEAVVATIVATLAVLGLAHSFGVGRGLIDRFATARDAAAAAQRNMETLVVASPTSPDLTVGVHPAAPHPVVLNNMVTGNERWWVDWIDDPADGSGAADPNPQDYKRVTVKIGWSQGGVSDTVSIWRYFLNS